jgi:myo-inositol 2-dehydrogenase / D-chiro-inositol 1-dehydrogenase
VRLNVGVIGTGTIGTYHAHRLAHEISGTSVTAVFDVDTERARHVGAAVGATVHQQAAAVVEDTDVDAVVIASPGELHAEQVLSCIAAGKPVLCEKPLATTTEDCLKVLEAEVAAGRRLVQVGFMRRFDPGYVEAKAALDAGDVGEPLLLHCVHRNASVPDWFTRPKALTDSVIHEVDTTRWLLGQEITEVSFRAGRKAPQAEFQDPQMVGLRTDGEVLIDVESFVNCGYGYDVRCEIVGSNGLVSVDLPTRGALTTTGRVSSGVPADWKERFGEAFRRELQAWSSAVGAGAGAVSGATAWDGYAATAVAEAGLASMAEGESKPVTLIERPTFYAEVDG